MSPLPDISLKPLIFWALLMCPLAVGCGAHNELQKVKASPAVHLLPPHTTAEASIEQRGFHGIDGPVPASVRVNGQSTLFPLEVRRYYQVALSRLGFRQVRPLSTTGIAEDEYQRGPLRAFVEIESATFLKPGQHTVFQFAVEGGGT